MRFLKKLKFLDFLIITAVLLAGVILFRFFNPQQQWVDASVYATNIPLFQASALSVGDVEKDPSGNLTAEIIRIRVYDTPQSLVANKDVLVSVKLLARVNPRSGDFEYKNKVLKIGTAVDMRFDTGFIAGKVASIGEKIRPGKMEERIVTIVLYEQWPWVADSIKVGDEEKRERGQDGENILEVVAKEVKPAEVLVVTSGGRAFKSIDPRKVDITLKIKLLVRKYGDELVFRNDERVAVGELISFTAGKTRIKDALVKSIE
ncbi:hypothetical protein HYZ78_00290 [Candidatus Microgenomates bacterium]|nr:hypothetical protein [Candidatus Microgenomates bacterium]